MKQPSLADLLTKIDVVADSVTSLHESVGSLQGLHGSVASLRASVGSIERVLERVVRTVDQHSVAVLELTTDVRHVSLVVDEHSATLKEHSDALNRIEQRQQAKTRARHS